MDLLCCENTEAECRAYPDPVLLNDNRVFENLLKGEERHLQSCSYFNCFQGEVTPDMRRIVAEWMLELCEEQNRQEEVFPLAMNYLDRFLATCLLRKSQLQLLGTACLILASKLREPIPLQPDTLVGYTANTITTSELRSWELLVLSKLHWDLSAVTPQDFLRHILQRLPIDSSIFDAEMIIRHAQTFILLCSREYAFSFYTPSTIAAASIAVSLKGLGWITRSHDMTFGELVNELQNIIAIDAECFEECLKQLEEIAFCTLNISHCNDSGYASPSQFRSLSSQSSCLSQSSQSSYSDRSSSVTDSPAITPSDSPAVTPTGLTDDSMSNKACAMSSPIANVQNIDLNDCVDLNDLNNLPIRDGLNSLGRFD